MVSRLYSAVGALTLVALCTGCANKSYPIVTTPKVQIKSENPILKSNITRHAARPGKDYDTELSFEPGVQYVVDRDVFEYSYSLTNQGKPPVRLEWLYVEASEFLVEPKKLRKLRKWLKPGESRSSIHESKLQSQHLPLPVEIYLRDKVGFDTYIAT